jgi:23S rRNA (pseudouridine1915-N3)-methyltransferase
VKYTLYNIGKTEIKYLREGIDEYVKRIRHFIDFSVVDLPTVKHTKTMKPMELSAKEGEIILQASSSCNLMVLLDEKGKELNTGEFAAWLEKTMNHNYKYVGFFTGGAYGFSDKVKRFSNLKISLSKMTFTHQMSRLIFVEQLYRALTIIRGVPYHND